MVSSGNISQTLPTQDYSPGQEQGDVSESDDFALMIYSKVQGHSAAEILRRQLDSGDLQLGWVTLHPLRNGAAGVNAGDAEKAVMFKKVVERHSQFKRFGRCETTIPIQAAAETLLN